VEINFKVEDLPAQETSCWHDLFVNPFIVYDFPIRKRDFGVGLEISVEMMARLGGAAHHVEYAGGILIKGFSAMFVPLKRVGNSVQWHFISTHDGSRLPYWQVDEHCPDKALLAQVDQEAIGTTRAFLGWWGNTVVQLGSSEPKYDEISWTELKEPGQSALFSGANIGFQTFGTGELNSTVGPKESKLCISRSGPYQRIVKYASNTPVVLFDPASNDRRGWLVPASSVIAHVALTRQTREGPKHVPKLKPVALTEADLSINEATEKMIFENAPVVLSRDSSSTSDYCFRDLVLEIWSILELLIDQGVRKDNTAGVAFQLPPKRRLRGWEFMDIVSQKSPMRLKETVVSKSAGNWTEFAQDIDAIVLFASGFQDLIIPRSINERQLCRSWSKVPTEKDYLTTTVQMLETLYEQAGSMQNRKYLTSTHLQWHRGPKLFEECDQRPSGGCKCDRVQQILKGSTKLGAIRHPGPLPAHGAVVFGKPSYGLKQSYTYEEDRIAPVICAQEDTLLDKQENSRKKKTMKVLETLLGSTNITRTNVSAPAASIVTKENKVD